MNEEEFFTQLQSICTDAIEEYRLRFPKQPPLSEHLSYGDSPLATEADIQTCFVELTHCYDALFDVDSTPFRNHWREHLVYDLSRRERLRLLASDPPESLTFFWIGGRYAVHTGHIGISVGQLPVTRAYSVLASELCHAYQHRFDSPTWCHPYLQEGFEKAASIRALTYLARELENEAIAHHALRQRASTLLKGTLAHGTHQGGITAASIRQLGVSDTELSALQAAVSWRVFGSIRPRYRWGSTAFFPEYDLFGSLLLVSDAMGLPDTYSRAFWGEHPWEEIIAGIRSTEPHRFWQWYHSKEVH
jgi:hypothetical protein